MFIAALFTIGKTWKQPQCSPTDEWIKKMWNTHTCTHTHTEEYYSPTEENDEWIKKMWNTHTLLTHVRCGIHTHTHHTTPTEEYYSPMEENDEWIKKM